MIKILRGESGREKLWQGKRGKRSRERGNLKSI